MVQPELRWQDPAENRSRLEALIRPALESESADLVLMPETFTTGFLGDLGHEPEPMNGPTTDWMRALAAEYGAALGGSVAIGDSGQRRNRFLFVTPDGAVEHYDKRHLFSYGGEDENYAPGNEQKIVAFRGWRISLNVCYDLRFPVWCRNRNNYDLSLFVANWPRPRTVAWSSLLKARAIENQACVIGINRVGVDGNGIEHEGQSAAFDGLGTELLNLGDAMSAKIVELDIEALSSLRAKFPFQADADSFLLDQG